MECLVRAQAHSYKLLTASGITGFYSLLTTHYSLFTAPEKTDPAPGGVGWELPQNWYEAVRATVRGGP